MFSGCPYLGVRRVAYLKVGLSLISSENIWLEGRNWFGVNALTYSARGSVTKLKMFYNVDSRKSRSKNENFWLPKESLKAFVFSTSCLKESRWISLLRAAFKLDLFLRRRSLYGPGCARVGIHKTLSYNHNYDKGTLTTKGESSNILISAMIAEMWSKEVLWMPTLRAFTILMVWEGS